MALAGDGNYYEHRWFTPWTRTGQIENYPLEDVISDITGQRTVPFGDAVLQTIDTSIACETCEELVSSSPPNVDVDVSDCRVVKSLL